MLVQRTAAWLDRQSAAAPERLLAVTHASVIRAAIVHALMVPLSAFWRIDIAPLTRAAIIARDGRWTLRAIVPPGAGESVE
jgi:broad specificity phosphatase PhoE